MNNLDDGGEDEEDDEAEAAEDLFVTLLVGNKTKSKLLKKCHSLPASFSSMAQLESERLPSRSSMVVASTRRGYFYESVGGVFYTLEWPLRSETTEASSSNQHHAKEMAPNVNDPDSGTHSMQHQEIAASDNNSETVVKNGLLASAAAPETGEFDPGQVRGL
jgi:hypothetical protein